MTDVRQRISQYTVNATPTGRDQYNYLWEITVGLAVQMDGRAAWAVRWMGRCLDADGQWHFEPIPSSRTYEWLAEHRHDLETAMQLAVAAAPDITVNGVKARDVA